MSANPNRNATPDNASAALSKQKRSCDDILARFRQIRGVSSKLVTDLSAEDACVQSMPDCSPAKWHLAHTTWFFETFVLEAIVESYAPFHPDFKVLFNSYYNSVGEQYSRPARGLLTRPSFEEVKTYRKYVNEQMIALLQTPLSGQHLGIIEVGLHHEQQHQELLLMDIKHLFSINPLSPTFRPLDESHKTHFQTSPTHHSDKPMWRHYDGGVFEIGADQSKFCFDNETPRHKTYLDDYQLANRLVSNAEYLEFIEDGGYDTPTLWLSDGWSTIKEHNWRAPLYWRRKDHSWLEFTLHGEQELVGAAPVVHISYYEADAFARWAGSRLPTEAEWEHGATLDQISAHCDERDSVDETSANHALESRMLQPQSATPDVGNKLLQLYDDVWQWTSSAYLPYPGYITPPGAIGEYNGKFMSNQMVLKGGGCVTPPAHSRRTYRNFFYPHCRWQFSGIRLAK